MSMFLFQVEQQNRLEQKGLLKRFSTKCYGTQATLESIRARKARQYNTLSKNRNSKEFEAAFLKYNPASNPGIVRGSMKEKHTPKTVRQTHEIRIDTHTRPPVSTNTRRKSPRRIQQKSYRKTPLGKNTYKKKNTPIKKPEEEVQEEPEEEVQEEPEEEVQEETPSKTLSIPKKSWLEMLRSKND